MGLHSTHYPQSSSLIESSSSQAITRRLLIFLHILKSKTISFIPDLDNCSVSFQICASKYHIHTHVHTQTRMHAHTLKHIPCGSLTVREWSKISTISRCSLSEKATAASLIQPISGINCHTTYKEQSVCICNANPAACCHMFNVCFLAFCCECRKRVKL